eukprot:CAMPEP_0195300146 /NCGR_PEP_ID=MMETSP0707-20130614/26812_1 /TAXON_ID=33640 /ORGANISM="Asterionellopsis glacialis, Strain CCMP134" /LENGTH=359 /DNA_ID=CAMNT_0040362743 /DNA_START=1 /DNA_END=1080 /DNA_ORIENTATION=+
MPAMTRGRADPKDFTATEDFAEYYSQRASAGLIITEGCSTSVVGRGWHRAPDMFNKSHSASWKPVTDAVHQKRGRIFCQLWHCGRYSHSSFRDGVNGFEGDQKKGVAPSPIIRPCPSGKQDYTNLPEDPDIEVPRELTKEEILEIPNEFKTCAAAALDAGFDGVEIHSSNGFLLDTFLQSCSNQRTDEYGGSKENRYRLVGEILKAVCEVFPSNRVGIRLSPNGAYNGMGSDDFRESFAYYISEIAKLDLAYLHITNGIGPAHKSAVDHPLSFADIRNLFSGHIIANSEFDAASAEKEISSGSVDSVSFGRIFLSNPDLPERFASGVKLNDIPDFGLWWSTAGNQLGAHGHTDFAKLQN